MVLQTNEPVSPYNTVLKSLFFCLFGMGEGTADFGGKGRRKTHYSKKDGAADCG